MTFEKFRDTITKLSHEVRQMALDSCTNVISDNFVYILSEIDPSPEGNFHDQRRRRIKSNNAKEPVSLNEACSILHPKYTSIFDVNIHIHKAKKNKTVIDIRYLRKNKLDKIQQELEKDNPSMFHAKMTRPPYVYDDNVRFDVNWEHQTFRNRWRIYRAKRRLHNSLSHNK